MRAPRTGLAALWVLPFRGAVNHLREHTPENIRFHCVIRGGGNPPNGVPEYARIGGLRPRR